MCICSVAITGCFLLYGVVECVARERCAHGWCTVDRQLGIRGDRTKINGIGQNGTDKMVATFIDSNSTELNFY